MVHDVNFDFLSLHLQARTIELSTIHTDRASGKAWDELQSARLQWSLAQHARSVERKSHICEDRLPPNGIEIGPVRDSTAPAVNVTEALLG